MNEQTRKHLLRITSSGLVLILLIGPFIVGAGVGALTGAITGRVKKGHEVR